jgi:hypothetical protein
MSSMPHATSAVSIVRPVPPFRLDLTVWALRRRARNAIDRWDGTTYRRVILLAGRPTELSVRQSGVGAAPRLVLTTTPPPRTPAERRHVWSLVDRLLGVRVDLANWYRIAERDSRLRPLAERFRGVKPPRFPTMFEALVNAFACQQLSLEVGLELLNRLAVVCGVKSDGGAARYAFPEPSDVVRLRPARYRAIGFSRQKVLSLLVLARAVERSEIDLEAFAAETDAEGAQVPLQHVRQEPVSERRAVKLTDDLLPRYDQNRGGSHGRSRGHTLRLACKATLSEEVACFEDRDDGFFAAVRQDRQLHRASFDIHDCIGGIALQKYG